MFIYIYSFLYIERVHQISHMFPRVSGVLVRLIQLCVQAGGAEPMLREPILEILWWRHSKRWFVALKLPDLSCLTVIVTCQLAAYQEISGLSLTTRPIDFGFAKRLLSWSSTRIVGSIVPFHPYGPTTLTADFLVVVSWASPLQWSMAGRAWHVLPRPLDIVISLTCLSERFEILAARILPIYQYLPNIFWHLFVYFLPRSNFSGQFWFSAVPKSVEAIPHQSFLANLTFHREQMDRYSLAHSPGSQVAKILTHRGAKAAWVQRIHRWFWRFWSQCHHSGGSIKLAGPHEMKDGVIR